MSYYRTPSSSANGSASSSPVFGPVDSSPFSSPGLHPISLDSPPHTPSGISHPFAASTKANRRPPQYEKKLETPPTTPPQYFSSKRLGYYRRPLTRTRESDDDEFFRVGSSVSGGSFSRHASHNMNPEEEIWDDALQKPITTGIGAVDLSNHRLTYIPRSISDLSNFFNTTENSEQTNVMKSPGSRAFSRIKANPEDTSSRTRSFERTKSIVESGKERHEIQLYLSGNRINSLPRELFSLQKMTVLVLRGNLLTSIPPEISCLTSLRELNISQNKLTYLPSELCNMPALTILSLNPNPFLQEPFHVRSSSPGSEPHHIHRSQFVPHFNLQRKSVSPIDVLVPFLPLTELCYRKLLTPISNHSGQSGTVMSEYYGLPLSDRWEDWLPPNVRETLAGCVPGAFKPQIISPTSTPGRLHNRQQQTYINIGACPSPMHRGSVFVKHAEERFTWERVISGLDVGGAVPVRWRGCLRGCLDFLLQASEDGAVEAGSPASGHDADIELNSDSDEDFFMAVDDEMDAVQVVEFSGGALDMDEFDD